ncbi:hypothetical protein ACOMHN_012020 [Nucella lapillus]
MKKNNADLFKKLNQQEKQIATLTRAQNDGEQHGRKWNLRVFNIPEPKPEESESSAECAKKVCHIFSTMVGASVSEEDIEIAHRVGQRMTSGSTRSRAIIVRFHSRQKKDGVLANRRRLKGNAKKISIDENVVLNMEVSHCGSTFTVNEFFTLRTSGPTAVEKQRVPIIPRERVEVKTKQNVWNRLPDIVGSGRYGVAYRAVLHLNAKTEAVVVKQNRAGDDGKILREAQFCQALGGTGYVPRLHGMVWGCHPALGEGLCLVQSLFAHGVTLRSVVDNFDNLPRAVRPRVAWNLAVGLKRIHDAQVVLNDLHAKNVLVDVDCPESPVRFIDMGMASAPKPSAPRGARHQSKAFDVLSLGMVLKRLSRGADLPLLKEASKRCLAYDPDVRDIDAVILLLEQCCSTRNVM